MRDRLIELLDDLGVTAEIPINVDSDGCGTYEIEGSEYIADHLIANGAIVPPCKIGDTVYVLSYNIEACQECAYLSAGCFAGDSFCTEDYSLYPDLTYESESICDKHFIEVIEFEPKEEWIILNRKKFGKTIFLTREDAERALRREDTSTDDDTEIGMLTNENDRM